MKRQLLRLARTLGFGVMVQALNRQVRVISSFTHWVQFAIQWGITPNPEWFDHFIDQHYQWTKTGIPFPWERGIFSLLAMRQGAKVLELCCGDGFNAHHFYSNRAGTVLSVDFDPAAIAHARKNFRTSNVGFQVADIRSQMPEGAFDNIIWDAAIEHFTEAEIAKLMHDITLRLKDGGILSGYTLVEGVGKSHHDHEYEFKSKEDLIRFLSPHFANVRVVETIYPTRHNLYFFAGNGVLPFDPRWQDHASSTLDSRVS